MFSFNWFYLVCQNEILLVNISALNVDCLALVVCVLVEWNDMYNQ